MPADTPATSSGTPTPPELTQAQEQTIHRTVCKVVAATALNCPRPELDPDLGGASSQNVMGCFITLKRQGYLRGCCGALSQPDSLFHLLCEVAATTASQDVRMPPVSPTELQFLDVTVSLLYGFRPLLANGFTRSEEVVIGEHGLRIQHGSNAGLLLPEVAVEHDLDATAFLRQVCRKAGLPADVWQDNASRILSFHTHVAKGPFPNDLITDGAREPVPIADPPEMERLARLCHTNLVALLNGATPSYYASDCPDGTVNGIAVHWIDAQGNPSSVGTISLRPGVPLQSTLFNLCQSAAKTCAAQRETAAVEFDNVAVDVTLLTDPSVHGTVDQHDLRGFNPSHRACLVMEAGKSAWVYDPQRPPPKLLEQAAKQVQVSDPTAAQVVSLAVQSTCSAASVSTVPLPQVGGSIRSPGVSGLFYPADPDELNRLVDRLLQQQSATAEDCSAIMVPHAGLQYSGRIAAAVFRRVKIPERVIIIGPKHTRLGVDWAVAPHERWSIGNQTLNTDCELAQQLSAAIPGLQLDSAAHAREHCIEVELPFLAQLSPRSQIVGIAIGSGNLERCQSFSDGLVRVIGNLQPCPLLIISSDMNHFAEDMENRRLDDLALRAMETLDPQRLYDTIIGHRISMCGVIPAVIVMLALHRLGCLNRCQRVAYETSADAGGDKSRVVGYAGMLFS